MSRPQKKGLDYFPHDTDARNDEKIAALMALYGAEGYAFYFTLLEQVFRAENGRITAGSVAVKAGYARAACLTPKRFEQILATALEIGCFDREAYTNEQVITSSGIRKRLDKVSHEREQERLRKEKILIAIKEKEEKKKNKYKEKEKEKEKTAGGKLPENSNPLPEKKKFLDFVYLTDQQYQKLCELFGKDGADEWIRRLDEYAHQKPQMFKVYDSHYHTITAWERKERKQGGGQLPLGGSKHSATALRMAEDIRKKKEAGNVQP